MRKVAEMVEKPVRARLAGRAGRGLPRRRVRLVAGSGDETDDNQSCKIDLSELDRDVFHLCLRPLTAGRVTAGWIEIRDVPVNDHARPHLLALRARWEARKAENAARKADGLKPLKGAGEPVSFRFKARARRGAGGRAGETSHREMRGAATGRPLIVI